MKTETEEMSREDERVELLLNVADYLEKRRREVLRAMDPGMGMDTRDPYLIGFSQGMRNGMKMAEDLVYCYMDWMQRGIYHPDAKSPESEDPQVEQCEST